MSEAISPRDMVVRQLEAERPRHGGYLGPAYAVVARRIGLSPRRVRAWWHGEVTDPRASEERRIRESFRAFVEGQERAASHEVALLRLQLAALEARL